MHRYLFRIVFLVIGILVLIPLGLVEARDYVTTVPGLVVTGEQDGQIFEYGVLKFDDGSGHIIMLLDRNLGAITNDITLTGSYGYHYQRGNNYGFSQNLNISDNPEYFSSTRVIFDGYGPTKMYNSPVFRWGKTMTDYWVNDKHYDGLWGGSGDNKKIIGD